MNLRLASVEDGERLEATHALAFDRPWSAADILRLMHMMGGFGLLAEADGRTTGFILARVIAEEAEILTLAVAPRARRRGLGRALVEAAAAQAVARGARAMFLEVAAGNAAAIGLYEGAGFQRVGLRRGYYAKSEGPAEDALVLRRPLNTP